MKQSRDERTVARCSASRDSGFCRAAGAAALLAAAAAIIPACGGSATSPKTVGGESHFLRHCTESCSDGLECISGLCTRGCVVDTPGSCADLAGAACTAASIEPGAVAVCDVSCSAAADCETLGGDYSCDNGFCRAPALSGTNGPNGDQSAIATGLDVLFENETQPSLIALDDRYLYWATDEGLRRAPLSGGTPTTLVAPEQPIRVILPDGEYVYFAVSAATSGRVGRVAREGGEPEWIAGASNPRSLAVDPESAGDPRFLYWSDPGNSERGSIVRADLDGFGVTELAANVFSPGEIELDGDFVYFTSSGESCSASSEGGAECFGGGIHRLRKQGGAPERLHATSAESQLVLNARGMYWVASSPPRIMFAPPGGAEREVVNVLNHGVGGLAADAEALYWASGDKLLRMSFEDETVLRLATELQGANAVSVAGAWSYVPEAGTGKILRIANDGSANRPTGPISGPCPQPIGEAAELALTPRVDTNLELLALSLEPGNVSASSEVYERVVADIAAIRALTPELAGIDFLAPHDGKTLYAGLTDIAAQSVRAGEYGAWDCLNEAYGLTSITLNETFGSSSVLIELHGIYDMDLVASLYGQLPGLRGVSANHEIGDGSTICAARNGERHEYVIDRAGGDCPEGCTEHEAHLYESDGAGQVRALDVWSSLSDAPAPEWFGRICD